MPGSATTLACTLNLLGRVAQLLVKKEGEDVWRWRIRLDYAHHPVAEGVTPTRIAAQVDAQLAVEEWLRQKHQQHEISRYIWIEEQ